MKKAVRFLYRIVQGALIGGGAILPGISGGVLAVLFGIYRPLMALLTHPIRAIRENWRLFVPVGIGAAAGFVLFAKLVSWMFTGAESYAVCLFIGLIIGTVPLLWKDAGRQGRGRGSILAMIAAFAALLAVLLVLDLAQKRQLTPSIPWYLFCGAVWGLSLIVPGMSSSSILIFLGLYQPMSDGIGRLDFGVILPVIGGIAVVALLLARLVNGLFERHYSIMSHAIVGFVAASVLAIVPTEFSGVWNILGCIGCAAAGFFIAYAMDVWGKKIKPEE